MRPRTTSNDESVRMLLYFVALLSYNLWIIARAESRAAVTLAVFVRQLLLEAEGQAQCGPRDPGGGARDPGGA